MHLIQFQKLQKLIEKTKDYIIQLKFETKRLHKENDELKRKLNEVNNQVPQNLTENLERLEEENTTLRRKHQRVSIRLVNILDKVKNLNEGVES
jgi:predicted nuclease with TOPRIM domain